MQIREKSETTINESWKANWEAFGRDIHDKLGQATSNMIDESKIKEMAESASSETYAALIETAGKVAKEITDKLKPQIYEMVAEYHTALTEALNEVIQELILQRVRIQMLKGEK